MEEVKDLMEKNIRALEDIDRRLHRIEKHFTWNTIFGFLKAILIIGPIVIGVIYLSPLVKKYADYLSPYLSAFNLENIKGNDLKNGAAINYGGLSPQIQAVFCDPKTRDNLVKQICQ